MYSLYPIFLIYFFVVVLLLLQCKTTSLYYTIHLPVVCMYINMLNFYLYKQNISWYIYIDNMHIYVCSIIVCWNETTHTISWTSCCCYFSSAFCVVVEIWVGRRKYTCKKLKGSFRRLKYRGKCAEERRTGGSKYKEC